MIYQLFQFEGHYLTEINIIKFIIVNASEFRLYNETYYNCRLIIYDLILE